MKKIILLALSWIVLPVIPVHAAKPPADAPVIALEHAWLTAAREHDGATLERILADDFIDIGIHGQTRDKAAALAHRGAPAGTSQTLRHLHVRRHGDMAIVTGINVVHSKTQGWTVHIAFTDVFVHQHGRWRAESAQETRVRPPRGH